MALTDAVPWSFALGGEMAERLEWLTDVLAPPYGPPQTRKLRSAPRTVLTFDGLEVDGARRWMATQVTANRVGAWHVPLAFDTTELEQGADVDDESLFLDTSTRRFVAGGEAVIFGNSPRDFEVVEIQSVAAGSITLAAPITRAWPAGSMVMPTVMGRLSETPVIEQFTGDAGVYSVAFRSDVAIDWPAAFGMPVYREFPVLEWLADWSTDPVYAPNRRIDMLDNSLGRVRLYDLGGNPMPAIAFDVVAQTREEGAALRSLLYALAGRWQPIWIASSGNDVEILATPGGVVVDIEWMGIAAWPLQSNRRDIRIEWEGGAPVYRRIVAAIEVNEGLERLQLDSALPAGCTAATIRAASFMALCLQDSDVNLLRSWSAGVTMTTLSFRGITHAF